MVVRYPDSSGIFLTKLKYNANFVFVGHCGNYDVEVIVKPHHEEDIFVITRGRGGGVNNKDILRVQVGFNWLLSQHGFYTTCLQ